MTEPTRDDEFEVAAESFVDRLRAGALPSISEYVLRHPELADEIRDLFPALVEVEGMKRDFNASSGPIADYQGSNAEISRPDRLGDYRILRVIGVGGMGVVYEAERESLQAHVALKVLHNRCQSDREYRSRFRNEARSAARLHHSNIVPVFDFGDQEGVLFCVMQYIPGHALDRILDGVKQLRGGKSLDSADVWVNRSSAVGEQASAPPDTHATDASQLSTLAGSDLPSYHREVARIGAEVAGALSYAHSRGVLHRDVKPSNLLIDSQGTPWITDFGLAKFEGSDDLTVTGDIVGTIRYMAPERFEGKSDARCDIYALGATLYEMLALRPAYEAPDRAALIRQIIETRPTPLRKLDRRISRDLETVVHKAIAHDPSDRYRSAADLAEELRRVIENRSILARRIFPHEQLWRWCKRNPLVAALATSAAILTILIAIVSANSSHKMRRANDEIREHLQRAEFAEAQRSEQLWEAKLAQARAGRFSRRSGQRFDTLAAIEAATKIGRQLGHPPSQFDKLRNEAIAALALPDIRITRTFGQVVEGEDIDLDEDFVHYVLTDRHGRAVVRRVIDDVEMARLPDDPEKSRSVCFGSDRWLIDVVAGKRLRAWDLSGGEPKVRIDTKAAIIWWDSRADGSMLATTHADGSIAAYELPSGRRICSFPRGGLSGNTMARLHPSAPFLLVTAYEMAHAEIRDLKTGATTRVQLPKSWDSIGAYGPDWTADGREFAVANGNGGSIAIYAFEPKDGSVRLARLFESETIPNGLILRFNPKGDRLLARGWAGSITMFDPKDGRLLFEAPRNGIWTPRSFRLDRLGRQASPAREGDYEPRYGIWSIADGRESPLLRSNSTQGNAGSVAISPDGRLVVTGIGQRLVFFEVATGRELGGMAVPKSISGPRPVFDGTGALLISETSKLTRWPVRQDPASPENIVVGPPERLDTPSGVLTPAASDDGRIVAVPMADNYGMWPLRGGWVLHRDKPGRASQIVADPTDFAAVSPDGRWVAFGSWLTRVMVYDIESKTKVWTSPLAPGSICKFSPDSKWLVTLAEGSRMFRVGTWEPGPKLGDGKIAAFLPGGDAAFLVTRASLIRMVETSTGRELARFQDPDESVVEIVVTPDGGKLLATHREGLRVWDLRKIRAELARMELDWDAPPIPAASPVAPVTSVRFVEAEVPAP